MSAEAAILYGRWCEGDEAAIEALVHDLERDVHPMLRRRGLQDQDREEVLQEVFLAIAGSRAAPIGDFEAWLTSTIENQASRAFREWRFRRASGRRAAAPESSESSEAAAPASDGDQVACPARTVREEPHAPPADCPATAAASAERGSAAGALARRLVARLDATSMRVVQLRDWNGESFAAIGRTLRMSELAVRVRHHRAIGKLRTLLARGRCGKTTRVLLRSVLAA